MPIKNYVSITLLSFGLLVNCSYRIVPDPVSDSPRQQPHNTRATQFRENKEADTQQAEEPQTAAPSAPSADPNLGDTAAPVAAASQKTSQRTEVRQIISNHKLDIRSCYTKFFGFERHSGQIVYEWEYNERGRVVSIHLVSTDFKMPKFEKCVEKVIRRMTFPRSSQESVAKVRFPFQFQ